MGMVTVARAEAKEGLSRAREVASIIAEMSGTKVHCPGPKRVHFGHLAHDRRGAPVLSLVVPAYNEATASPIHLNASRAFSSALHYDSELIVVDDGSADAGRKAVEEALAVLRPGLDATPASTRDESRQRRRRPHAAASLARGNYVAFIDADLATPPESLASAGRSRWTPAPTSLSAFATRLTAPTCAIGAACTTPIAGKAFALAVNAAAPARHPRQPVPAQGVSSRTLRSSSSLCSASTPGRSTPSCSIWRTVWVSSAQVPVAWSAVEGSHLRLTGAVGELLNLLRIRWMHRGVKRSLIKTSQAGNS